MQKSVIIEHNRNTDLSSYFQDGWKVISTCPFNVSAYGSSSSGYHGGKVVYGKVLVILEKTII